MRTTSLEDIGGVIGYTATRVLSVWYAGRNLYVPTQAKPDHPLVKLIGMPALRRLVDEFAVEHLCIPPEEDDARLRRDRVIAERLASGLDCATVADQIGLSVRRVEQIRSELLANGWLAYAEGSRRRSVLVRDATVEA